jgi:hypothetical protein
MNFTFFLCTQFHKSGEVIIQCFSQAFYTTRALLLPTQNHFNITSYTLYHFACSSLYSAVHAHDFIITEYYGTFKGTGWNCRIHINVWFWNILITSLFSFSFKNYAIEPVIINVLLSNLIVANSRPKRAHTFVFITHANKKNFTANITTHKEVW